MFKKLKKSDKRFKAAINLMNKIDNLGYSSYLVGGFVRDFLLGVESKDIDITTNCPINILEKNFKCFDIGKSKTFGILVIKIDDYNFEVAQYRSESDYTDGRRPESVSFNVSIENDLSRRDITINSLAMDKNGNIIDFHSGQNDIKNKIIRTVNNPYERFSEDFLRILRIARFSAKLNFKIEKETKKAAKKLSKNISKLAVERIYDELKKSANMNGKNFANYILILDELKILKIILPEVKNLQYYKERLDFHPETRDKGGTVYAHVIEALKQVKENNLITMLSVLFHDLGKALTLSEENGLPRYKRHERKSLDLIDEICDRLKISNKDRESFIFSAKNHMKFHNLLGMKPSKIAKLVNDKNWDVLVSVARADEFSRGEIFKHAGEFEKIIDKAIKIKNKYGMIQVNKTLKVVDGNRVMSLTGLKPGKKVGDIIRKVTEKVMDKGIDPNDQKTIDKLIMGEI